MSSNFVSLLLDRWHEINLYKNFDTEIFESVHIWFLVDIESIGKIYFHFETMIIVGNTVELSSWSRWAIYMIIRNTEKKLTVFNGRLIYALSRTSSLFHQLLHTQENTLIFINRFSPIILSKNVNKLSKHFH